MGRAAFSIVSTTLAPVVLLLLILPTSINGQRESRDSRTTPNAPAGGSKPPAPVSHPSIRERQFKMLEMEREAAKPKPVERDKMAQLQIAEDFEKIQVINNKMMSLTMRAAAPDYGIIANTTSEIRKRASRLKENLGLEFEAKEDSKEKTKGAVDVQGIKADLMSLDNSIMSFVKNPIFKTPGVVNVEQAEKASNDLDVIIKLSQLIRKDAERLEKSSPKSP